MSVPPSKDDSVIEIYISPKSRRKVWDADSESRFFFQAAPQPKLKKNHAEHHVYFPRESALHTFASFSVGTAATPTASVQSVNRDGGVISINRDEIPAFECIRNKNKFVRGTFAILICHFLLILALLLLLRFVSPVRLYVDKNKMIFIIIFLMNYLGLEVILVCSAKLRRYFPVNCILFILITFSLGATLVSFSVSCSAVLWSSIYGTALAVVVLLTISLLSCQKKWEVTNVCMHIFTFLYMSVITGFVTIALNFTHFKECDIWFMFITSAIMQILILWLLYVTRQIAVCEKERLCCQEYVYGAITLVAYLPLFPMAIIKFIKYCRKL